MKTAIFTGDGPAVSWTRLSLRCAIAMAVLAASNLFGGPVVKTLGGGTSSHYYGYLDGETLQALFHTPMGIAADEDGDLFVADYGNNAIRELYDFSGTGNGSTLTWVTNHINSPVGVAVDANENLFVLNRGSTTALSTNGTVLEFDAYGILVATNATHLTNATAIALDFNDNIYVTERTNLLIEITPTNKTTLATVTAPGAMLEGISVLPNGNIAACDFGRDGILTINPTTETITTNAGFNGPGDGTGPNNVGIPNSLAQFLHPFGVAAAGDGTLIVSDYGNGRVKVVTVAGVTTNLYGVSSNDWDSSYYPGWADGTVVVPDAKDGVASRCPVGVSLSGDGSTVYTSEDYYHIIRQTTGAAFAQFVTPPGPPAGLTATVITNAGVPVVALSWDAAIAGGVTNYLVERSVSTNAYTLIGLTSGTTFTDTNVVNGETYYYIVQAENSGGESADSLPASVTIPITPPPAPTIGWFDYQGNDETGFFTQLNPFSPGTNNVFNNLISIAILPNESGIQTYYIYGATPLSGNPAAGANPPTYANNMTPADPPEPLPVTIVPNMTIEAVNVGGGGESPVVTDEISFQCGNPEIEGTNAAQFTLNDVTTNVTYYYTTDGTDPLTNAPASQQIVSSNGAPLTLSINISTNFTFEVVAEYPGFAPSIVESNIFLGQNFHANTISWGFAQGECSSAFVAAAGQTFYAPVTLTTLPKAVLYSLQFNMTVGNSGPGITNAAPAGATPLGFQSMLMQPIPGTAPPEYEPIPPWVFAAELPLYEDTNIPPQDYVTNGADQVFVNLETSNENELAVGWVERAGFTNLYPTTSQTLIQYSQAHDDLFPDAAVNEPNGVIVGAYSFNVSPSAVNGQQYQVQINQASGTADGIGAPGESVDIYSPDETNAGSLGPGTLNAIKNITIGSIPYLVGNVYPFSWFNAGDFGNSNLQNADVLQVFEAAVYLVNEPVHDTNSFNIWTGVGYTNVSDMYDAMDSCGSLGVFDNNSGDQFYGYYTNAGPANVLTLLSGSLTNINQMAFGDGNLDICDVYVTFLRSEFTNQLVWFQRLWTNGVRVATASYAPGIISAATTINSGGGKLKSAPAFSSPAAPVSITNTPLIHFTSTNFVASAGQTVTVPINATVFGSYPARMMLLNVSVVPLDGSPALTVPVQFTPSSSLSTAFGSSTPWASDSSGNGNYSAVWFPTSLNPVPGFTNTANIGTLTVTIPTNATSLSSYAIHFDKASASPSGLVAFPEKTITGLITLSSRTSSYYNDGIPDSWRLRYFGTIYNELSVSNADADGTGMNNWQKYSAGLDPTDPTSVLNEGTDQKMAQNTQDLVLYWPTVNGQTYLIQRSTSLFPPQWTTISTNIGDGTYMEIHDTSGGNKRYYQVITQ